MKDVLWTVGPFLRTMTVNLWAQLKNIHHKELKSMVFQKIKLSIGLVLVKLWPFFNTFYPSLPTSKNIVHTTWEIYPVQSNEMVIQFVQKSLKNNWTIFEDMALSKEAIFAETRKKCQFFCYFLALFTP